MKLDKTLDAVTIRAVGPEDRAMLRSNPSAVADAGMRAIGSGTGDCAPARERTYRSLSRNSTTSVRSVRI